MLQRGAWLSATHDDVYGHTFKSKYMSCCWSGSRALYERANALATRSKDVYQFGVYTGGSMRGIARRVRGFGHMWGVRVSRRTGPLRIVSVVALSACSRPEFDPECAVRLVHGVTEGD